MSCLVNKTIFAPLAQVTTPRSLVGIEQPHCGKWDWGSAAKLEKGSAGEPLLRVAGFTRVERDGAGVDHRAPGCDALVEVLWGALPDVDRVLWPAS